MRRDLLSHPFRTVFASGALLAAVPAAAADTLVAVAANFTAPAKAIAAAFTHATGDTATLSFGASGGVLHPDDARRAVRGLRVGRHRTPGEARGGRADRVGDCAFVYAVGRLVLYSATPGLVDGGGKVLATGDFAHLAIADPAAAPYGAAAVETLKNLKLYDRDAPRFVTGSSIAQAYQFVATGAAELGFVAASEVIDVAGGSHWAVPETLHAPIEQAAVVLKTGAANPAAAAFVRFLHGPEARAIIRRYGYAVQ